MRCTGCLRNLPAESFRKDVAKPLRRSIRCKECDARRDADRHANNRKFRQERLAAGDSKTCKKCSRRKLIVKFPASSATPGGTAHQCHECALERLRGWRARNPEHVKLKSRETQREQYARDPDRLKAILRRSRLKTKYGLSEATFDLLLDSQGHACAICRRPLGTRKPNVLINVDHDHETGAVRGLLCRNCNNGLGCFKDKPELLVLAINYLKKHKG